MRPSNMPPAPTSRSPLLPLLAAALLLAACRKPEGPAVRFRTDLDAALADAKAAGKPALIDFHASWCAACDDLDRFTYTDPAVVAEAARFEAVKVDVTNQQASEVVQARFGVVGLPTIVLVDGKGEVLRKPRALGFVDGPELVALLQQVR